MQVLICNDYAWVNGGFSQVAIASALGLADRGWQVWFLAAVGPADERLAAHPNVRLRVLGQPDLLKDPSKAAAAVRGIRNGAVCMALRDWIVGEARGVRLIHFHLWTKALSAAALAAAVATGKRVVASIQEYQAACPAGTFYHFGEGQVCHRRPLSAACIGTNCDSRAYTHKLYRVARGFAQRAFFRIPQRLRHFITVSGVAETAIRPYLHPAARCYRLDNPIWVEPRPPATPATSQDFLFVGRFSKEKDPVGFATAARCAGVPAVFVGDGELRQDIQGANPEARLLGWKTNREVLDLVRGARALVFPSTWYEGQPLVPIEACSQGVPPLVSDCTAAVEYVTHGVNGLHVRQGNVEDLIAKLRLCADDALVERMGRRAHAWYWSRPWTLERHVTRLERIYAAILGGPDVEADYARAPEAEAGA